MYRGMCTEHQLHPLILSTPPPTVKSKQPHKAGGEVTYSLVAFPAKDNYEGRLYPLDWINKVRLMNAAGAVRLLLSFLLLLL